MSHRSQTKLLDIARLFIMVGFTVTIVFGVVIA